MMYNNMQPQNDIPLNSISLEDLDENSKFTPLPTGAYNATITSAREGYTGKGAKYLQIRFTVDDGQWAGYSVCSFLYVYDEGKSSHSSVMTARKILKSIRQACGLQTQTAGDPDDLVGHKVKIRVTLRENIRGEMQSYVQSCFPPSQSKQPSFMSYEPTINGRLW